MKKLCIILPLILLFVCNTKDTTDVARKINYYFPENKTACAFVFYDVEAAPALTIKDHVVDYHLNEENILTTSSPSDFGWASEKFSGPRHVYFFNSDGSQIMDEDKMPLLSNGSVEVDGIERHYDGLHFSDKEECFSDDSFEDFDIFSELVREIYKENTR